MVLVLAAFSCLFAAAGTAAADDVNAFTGLTVRF
jgi:hypothetical protein